MSRSALTVKRPAAPTAFGQGRNVVALGADGLPERGFVRLQQLLAVIPMSRSQAYVMIGDGRLPAYKISAGITLFNVTDIRSLLQPIAGALLTDGQDAAAHDAPSDKSQKRPACTYRRDRAVKNIIPPDTS